MLDVPDVLVIVDQRDFAFFSSTRENVAPSGTLKVPSKAPVPVENPSRPD